MSFKMAENLFKGLKYFLSGEGLQNISNGIFISILFTPSPPASNVYVLMKLFWLKKYFLP